MKRIGKMDNLEVDFVAIDENDITYRLASDSSYEKSYIETKKRVRLVLMTHPLFCFFIVYETIILFVSEFFFSFSNLYSSINLR